MKKIVLTSILLFFSIMFGFGQKFALVDTEYILSNIPTYEAAQEQLDELAKSWKAEIDKKYKEVEEKYKEYQAEKVLLSEEMRRKKEEEIIQLEREAKDLQKKYFGPEGELSKKQDELIKPIQDEIYNAVKEIATEGNINVIFDTGAGLTILYSDAKYDKSDEVLRKMGYNN